jgi:DNA-binding GntR family transcriptional regulator
MNGIFTGHMEFGAPLRLNEIARMLAVSTTPVREALGRLESSGVVVKVPNCGWFVRRFSEHEIRDMHEVRGSIESLSVRLASQRITEEELEWLDQHQIEGERALRAADADAYLVYNRDFHGAILRAARNSCLTTMVGQLEPQSQMLTARSIRIPGRMQEAFDEHSRILECISARDADGAEKMMKVHILSALVEFLRLPETSSVSGRAATEIEEFLLGKKATISGSETPAYEPSSTSEAAPS